ncbi:type II toxin-antitoxin system prevent-host-death family antitoxin [bacterium]|nr:type II toxin-antitoxin system prevent-host-death family antitoxin [bacterium]
MITYKIELAKERFEELLNDVEIQDKIIRISNDTENAILISKCRWNSIKETLFLFSITGMKDSIMKGMEIPVDECSGEVEW